MSKTNYSSNWSNILYWVLYTYILPFTLSSVIYIAAATNDSVSLFLLDDKMYIMLYRLSTSNLDIPNNPNMLYKHLRLHICRYVHNKYMYGSGTHVSMGISIYIYIQYRQRLYFVFIRSMYLVLFHVGYVRAATIRNSSKTGDAVMFVKNTAVVYSAQFIYTFVYDLLSHCFTMNTTTTHQPPH